MTYVKDLELYLEDLQLELKDHQSELASCIHRKELLKERIRIKSERIVVVQTKIKEETNV
jgi:phage shock protein A